MFQFLIQLMSLIESLDFIIQGFDFLRQHLDFLVEMKSKQNENAKF